MNKTLLSSILLLFLPFFVNGQQSLNMTLLYNWDDNSLPAGWTGQYNDIWGYADGQGREYAIIGVMLGTYFFDITDPQNPVIVDYEPSKDQFALGVHRDYKTYQNYCYAVADEGANSLQIFDLQYLPDSVHKVYDSDQFCIRAHNIFIGGEHLYLASNSAGGNFNAMDVLSLSNPANPAYVSTLQSSQFFHVHDVYVRNDTAYCSNGNDGLFIYDYTDAANPVLINSITNYPQSGYNHSSWTTDDGDYIVFADENHGKAMKIYDISDLQNPTFMSTFQTNLLNVPNPSSQDGSIPHNPFILGDKAFVSYYHDGVQVYDISNPLNPVVAGYYDTHPQSTNYGGYQGCWGVYPYLPSGVIIASDIDNGLFIFDASAILGLDDKDRDFNVLVYPNPVQDVLWLELPEYVNGEVSVEMFDVLGKNVYSNISENSVSRIGIDVEYLPDGIYVLSVRYGAFSVTKKIIRNSY